jgi:hypothetical protein
MLTLTRELARELAAKTPPHTYDEDKPAERDECELGADCPFRRICLSEGRKC